eukprot:scaffold56579_cov54-Phaeocystis_antarctica.AAC.3
MYARHNPTITPRAPFAEQADDNPMGDIGKKISDFFSGLMPKDEEPPTHARWSEQGGPPCGGGRGHPVAASLRPLSTTSTAKLPPSPPLSSGVLRVYLDAPVARQPRPLRRAEVPCWGLNMTKLGRRPLDLVSPFRRQARGARGGRARRRAGARGGRVRPRRACALAPPTPHPSPPVHAATRTFLTTTWRACDLRKELKKLVLSKVWYAVWRGIVRPFC